MRIVFISDSHSLHEGMLYTLPKGNILCHAGDCTNMGKQHEIHEFVEWFKKIEGYDHKIFIAGNHDFGFELFKGIRHKNEDWIHQILNKDELLKSNVIYLEDEEYVVTYPNLSRPVKFYGSPWQPEFYNWAFNLPRNGEELEKKWNAIPNDTDVLITHGPPFGILDYPPHNVNVGCEILRFRVEQIDPLIHVFGHIHHSRGLKDVKDSLFINASICNERYQPINKPIVIELVEFDNQIVTSIIDY
jgi:Icc-related predicted phosphoesterase